MSLPCSDTVLTAVGLYRRGHHWLEQVTGSSEQKQGPLFRTGTDTCTGGEPVGGQAGALEGDWLQTFGEEGTEHGTRARTPGTRPGTLCPAPLADGCALAVWIPPGLF